MRLPFLSRQPPVPPRHLIVGLGNPGAEYHHTRHNVGFRAIDLLAECHKIDTRKTEKRAFVGYGKIGDVAVVLAKPITFMNLSGESIAPLLRMLELTPADLIVVYDDMDLPLGRIRVRPDGSAGGHNGIKSLIHHLRTQEFPRIKIGVGRPGVSGPTTGHVLGKFVRSELEPIQAALARASEAVEVMVTEGTVAAMNRFNPSPTPPPAPGPSPE